LERAEVSDQNLFSLDVDFADLHFAFEKNFDGKLQEPSHFVDSTTEIPLLTVMRPQILQ
jgi:hypothetical protein